MLDQNISEINHNASPFTPALKYGVIRGLIAVAIVLVMYLSGMLESSLDGSNTMLGTITWLVGLGLTVLFVVLAINEHKANRGGNISIGQAIGVGILTTLVYGVIVAIWTYVFYNFIFTGYEEVMLDMITAQYEEAGMSDEEIETAMGFAGAFTSPAVMAGMAGFMPLFTGLFAGLITGAAVKTN
jgi:Flp pilus assembly pilin Flp